MWGTGSGCAGFSTGASQLWCSVSRTQAQQLWPMDLVAPGGMWDLPGPGTEPMSPASAGGFLPTMPAGKPQAWFLMRFMEIMQD